MAGILILYATVDGHTRRIAEFIGDALRAAGHEVTVQDAASGAAPREIENHAAVMIGAAIRYGHYPACVEALVRQGLRQISSRPNAFFSVCLSAGGPGAKPATAQAYIDGFSTRTGWLPAHPASFAGAPLYRRYNPFIRLMMRLIVGAAGGETDTSRDYEYTDWKAVERFAQEFGARAAAVPAPERSRSEA